MKRMTGREKNARVSCQPRAGDPEKMLLSNRATHQEEPSRRGPLDRESTKRFVELVLCHQVLQRAVQRDENGDLHKCGQAAGQGVHLRGLEQLGQQLR